MTPEEIVKALLKQAAYYYKHIDDFTFGGYDGYCELACAADLIKKQANQIKALTARAEKAEAELKEAVEDIKKYRGKKCDGCYYAGKSGEFVPCRDCQSPISNCGDKWKWRGAREGTR